MDILPVLQKQDELLALVQEAGALVLTAPTGSGKSTQVPRLLLDQVEGQILVLQPPGAKEVKFIPSCRSAANTAKINKHFEEEAKRKKEAREKKK